MKLLLGGSPCTHWSTAQTKDRETEPSGIGWELFENYRIARDKYKPDYFLYENNKSMSPAIRAQITRELGVEPVLINSALVSAQNRQRLYWVGKREPDGTYSRVDVEQPEDRGILLRDILESGMPVNITEDGKAYAMKAQYYKSAAANFVNGGGHFPQTGAAEPVSINRLGGLYGQHTRWGIFGVNGKVPCLTASMGAGGGHIPMYPVRVGDMPTKSGKITGSQNARIYDVDGKSPTLTSRPNGGGVDGPLCAVPYVEANYEIIDGSEILISNGKIRQGDAAGSKQGKYVYTELAEKSNTISAGQAHNEKVLVPKPRTGNFKTIYEVRGGLITIKGKQYPIKLADGYYIIRKLTVRECMRLQTVPEWYIFPVSDTQAYKMLGNGWTIDVIAHILSHIPGITTEPVEVLSMYDGLSCGHIALDKLGANVVSYYATEIDKYAIMTTQANYPDTVQLGDAFGVRDNDWRLKDG